MATCFFSSRAMPWLSGGDRRRSMTPGKLQALPGERLLSFRQLGPARSLEQLMRSELMRFQPGHFVLIQLRLGPLE
jgi:hypothetical protein